MIAQTLYIDGVVVTVNEDGVVLGFTQSSSGMFDDAALVANIGFSYKFLDFLLKKLQAIPPPTHPKANTGKDT